MQMKLMIVKYSKGLEMTLPLCGFLSCFCLTGNLAAELGLDETSAEIQEQEQPQGSVSLFAGHSMDWRQVVDTRDT